MCPNPAKDDTLATSVATLSWKDHLITKEDPYHIHKTLGSLVLMSYTVRLMCHGWDWMNGIDSDMGFATHPEWTLPTVFLHLLLNVSSFEFKLPSRRIASGYRIWPEYRVHSLTFLMRHLGIITLYWYERTYRRTDQPPLYWMNLVIVLMNLVGADLGSYWTRPHNSRSIRDLQFPVWVKYCFSLAQFGGTVSCLYGIRQYSLPFLMCMIIQCNAFFMTLQRKNLASHSRLLSCYGIMIVLVTVIGNAQMAKEGMHHVMLITTMVFLSFLMRVTPRFVPVFSNFLSNKYIIWPVIWCLIQRFRLTQDNCDSVPISLWVVLSASFMCVVALGRYKCLHDNDNEPFHIKGT